MRTLIAVVAFNEDKNIAGVLSELQAFRSSQDDADSYDIVVIDNASTDTTPACVRAAAIPLVRHAVNNGGSMGTVLTYFRYAAEGDYDALVQFDGDGQHVSSEIPKILEPIRVGEADYVIGSRYLENKGFQSTLLRRVGIRLFNLAIRWAGGERISDSTSGFRAYNRKVIDFFSNRFPHELTNPIQLVILSKYYGARILEVPVIMRERVHGNSEFHAASSLRFVLKGLVTVFGCRLQKGHLLQVAQTGPV